MRINNRLESDHLELDQLFEQVLTSLDGGDCTDIFQKLDFFWARLAMHIRAEHRCLFPAIRAIPQVPEGIPEMLYELRHDHDFFMTELARAIKAVRLTFYFANESETTVTVRTILEQIKERLEIHNRIEEERIYPLAKEESLMPEGGKELALAIEKELNNYPQRFGKGAP